MPENELPEVSLDNLKNGAAVERFNYEMAKVFENIKDQNTTLGNRSVTLKVTFKPNEDRDACATAISVSSSLAPMSPVATELHIGLKDNVLTGFEADPRQLNMFDKPGANIQVLPEREATNGK